MTHTSIEIIDNIVIILESLSEVNYFSIVKYHVYIYIYLYVYIYLHIYREKELYSCVRNIRVHHYFHEVSSLVLIRRVITWVRFY